MVLVYILLFIIVICFVASYFIFNFSLNRNSKKDSIFENDMNKVITRHVSKSDIEWFEINHDEITIKSSDGFKLKGYKIKNKNNKYVILVHGYTSKHEELIGKAKKFYDLGFGILLIDLRAHGKSGGKYITMGVKDSEDLRLWVDYLIEKDNANYIGLFGISMGAATVMTSLESMPSQVKFAVEDCGYSSVWNVLKYQLCGLFHLPVFPFLYICNLYAKIFAKYDFKTKSSVKSLANTNIPILMIHGTKDTFVPYYMLDQNFNACKSKKEKLIVEGANHAQAEDFEPQKYWKTISKFIDKL